MTSLKFGGAQDAFCHGINPRRAPAEVAYAAVCLLQVAMNPKMPYESLMTLTAVYQKDPESGWYTAQIKEIPQAISQGETLEEARENLKDALETVFRFLADETETAPGAIEETFTLA